MSCAVMRCGVAIFVKTPSLSAVKTRLWPGIGRRNAEALYLSSAQAVASVAMQANPLRAAASMMADETREGNHTPG